MSVKTEKRIHAMVYAETYLGLSTANVHMGPMEALGRKGDVASRAHP